MTGHLRNLVTALLALNGNKRTRGRRKDRFTNLRNVLTVLNILAGLTGDLETDLARSVVTSHGGNIGALLHLLRGALLLHHGLAGLLGLVGTLHGRDINTALGELNILTDFLHYLLAISHHLVGTLLCGNFL